MALHIKLIAGNSNAPLAQAIGDHLEVGIEAVLGGDPEGVVGDEQVVDRGTTERRQGGGCGRRAGDGGERVHETAQRPWSGRAPRAGPSPASQTMDAGSLTGSPAPAPARCR